MRRETDGVVFFFRKRHFFLKLERIRVEPALFLKGQGLLFEQLPVHDEDCVRNAKLIRRERVAARVCR